MLCVCLCVSVFCVCVHVLYVVSCGVHAYVCVGLRLRTRMFCSLCTEWSLSSLLTSVCMLCVCLCLCVSVLCVCTHTNVILCCVYVCVGLRSEISEADLSKVLPEEVAAEISMGTEVLYA